jgi:hypothetical protein
MRTKRTGLICLFIGAINFCLPSAEGQDIKSAVQGVAVEERMESSPATAGVQLRLDVYDTEAAYFNKADSSITYNGKGEPVNKYVYYYGDEYTFTEYTRENGEWIFVKESFVYIRSYFSPHLSIREEGTFWFTYRTGRTRGYMIAVGLIPYQEGCRELSCLNPEYNEKGHLISFEWAGNPGPVKKITWQTFGNGASEYEVPILIQDYWDDSSPKHGMGKEVYQYDSNGCLTLFEQYGWDWEKEIWTCSNLNSTYSREVNLYSDAGKILSCTGYRADETNNRWIESVRREFRYDENQRETEVYDYVWSDNAWAVNEYTVHYYADSDVSSECIENANEPSVHASQNVIHIRGNRSERITVYSVNGSKVFETAIQPGLTSIDAARFPKGILIVRGSSGWTKKVAVY